MDNTAKQRLLQGNARYIATGFYHGDVSATKRESLAIGQHPYAAVLSCADSRVIPEVIFDADLGDLFVVRAAGNVAEVGAIASLQYAVCHLGVDTVVVLGHTSCGAIAAALDGETEGEIGYMVKRITTAIAGQRAPTLAAEQNTRAQRAILQTVLQGKAQVFAAIYDIADGSVRFLK